MSRNCEVSGGLRAASLHRTPLELGGQPVDMQGNGGGPGSGLPAGGELNRLLHPLSLFDGSLTFF